MRILVGVSSCEIWMDGWMQECRRVVLMGYLVHNMGK